MNQLRKDFGYLREMGIGKPSGINSQKLWEYNKKTQDIITRYKNLLMHKILMNRNNIAFEEASTTMTIWAKNWKKKVIDDFQLEWVDAEFISYPLLQIFNYIKENITELVWDNKKQIEISKKFKVKNLWILYRIIKSLWLLEELDWKSINMSVEKFETLIQEIENLETNKKDIVWEDFINIWNKIWIYNPQNLHTWLSALWIVKKYWLVKIRLSKNDDAIKIKDYIEQKYWKKENSITFTNNDIDTIILEISDILPKTKSNKIKSVKSVLKFFWYSVEDSREAAWDNSNYYTRTRPTFYN